MEGMEGLDAHEKAPEVMRQRYKKYQKISLSDIDSHLDVIDLQRVGENGLPEGGLLQDGSICAAVLNEAFADLLPDGSGESSSRSQDFSLQDVPIFAHLAVSGQILIKHFPSWANCW